MPPAALHLPQGSEWTALVVGYLLGSIPFGLLMARAKGVDLRTIGSGNIGATNVGRALGKPYALVAFAFDFAKGFAPTYWLGTALAADPTRAASLAVLAGSAAACGHVWPVFLRFRGGKAVATACGAVVAVDPLVFVVGGVGWLVTIALTRYAGLASMVMGALFPLTAWWQGEFELAAATIALEVLIVVRHRSNIGRMIAGTESRFGRDGGGERG